MPPSGYEANQIRVTIGDDFQVDRTIPDVPAGQALAQAWWTVKASLGDPDSAAVWQKSINTSEQLGVGQILDAGASGVAKIRFDGSEAESALLSPGVEYLYDIQLLSTAGKKKTIEKGTLVAEGQVTQA
jgi:hypothetical protein